MFTLRNKYTERSLRFYKANPKANISKINAVTGTISTYMDLHESGGYRTPKQGRAVPVATLAARGGKATNTVRRANYAGQLGPNRFIGTPKGAGSRGQRPYGVYARTKKNKHLVMIRNISQARVQIKESRWHSKAMSDFATRKVLTDEFVKQAQRKLAELGAK
jgi:hypothetical protein